MSHDKSILLTLEEQGLSAPRVALKGTERNASATARYEILGEIARGGVGIVHRGRDNDVGRDVALKVLRDKHLGTPELVQRFVEEAQIGGQLQHPGIVPVYELGLQSDKRPYFAMKLVKGETLAARLDARTAPSDDGRTLLAVFRDVCRTMAYAHSRGVIHRDLKPSNIMIGSFAEVQIVDWGFAKVLRKGGVADEGLAEKRARDRTMVSTVRSGEGDGSIAGSVMGTPAYMPPEQALGRVEDLNERSDIFSLGAILCEILTGEAPYDGSEADRIAAAAQGRLEAAQARLATCDADPRLVDLCRQCLEPLPRDRPASAQGAPADTIATYLTSAEGRAHRAAMRALKAEAQADEQRRARRQTKLVGGSVLAVLMVAVGGYFWVDADRTRRAGERTHAIELALQDAARLRSAKDWPAALAAAGRAIDLGHDGAIAQAIHAEATEAAARAEREKEDDALLAELEEIRGHLGGGVSGNRGMRPAEGGATASILPGMRWGREPEAVEAAYVAAFERRFGSVEAGLERMRDSRHAKAFAANLGYWSSLRASLPDADWRQIQRLIRALDSSNGDVRDALLSRDVEALLAIARERGNGLPLALAAQVASGIRSTQPLKALTFLQAQHLRAPGDFWINFGLGNVARGLGKHELALRHFTAALTARPEHVATWNNLGITLSEMGDLAGAVQAYRRALEHDPDMGPAHFNLCSMLAELGNFEGLLVASGEAEEEHPEAAWPHAWRGRAFLGMGDLGPAVRALRRSLKLDADQVWAYSFLAEALYANGDLKGAIDAMRKAVARDASLAWAQGNLGLFLFHAGDLDSSIEASHEAIKLDSRLWRVYSQLGLALGAKGEWRDAALAYRRAIELGSSGEDVPYNLSIALFWMADYKGSIQAARDALLINPKSAAAYGQLGTALHPTGDFKGALAALRKALDLDPRLVQARAALGEGLLQSGDYDGAITACREALALPGVPAAVYHTLGRALYRKGSFDEALKSMRRGLELDPGNSKARMVLAKVEREAALHGRLSEVLAGDAAPADWREALGFACLAASLEKDYAGGLRLYRQAFEAHPASADDLVRCHRYNAACAASRAGAPFHSQALAWLRADLELWAKRLEADPVSVTLMLTTWKQDSDIAPIRDADDLAPEFRKLWADVDALLERARAVEVKAK